MSAARYVGRVGGLAVALGIGAAIFTGQSAASADTGAPSSGSESASTSDTTTTADSTTSPDSATTASDTDGVDSAASPPVTRVGAMRLDRTDRPQSGPRARTHKREVDSAEPKPATTAEADNAENRSESRRSHTDDATTDQPVDKPEAAEAESLSTVTTLDVDVPDPSVDDAGNTPASPRTDGPALFTLLGTARRESDKLDYAADFNVDNGVITGINQSQSSGVTYTAVGKPDDGAKVVVDKTTGNFSFLPYSSQLTTDGAGEFRVLVAETTLLDAVLERLPIVKTLVQPIIIRLHELPIIRDVLAPVIGRSKIYTVEVPIGLFVGEGKPPIAFTTTVVSFDDTPISVNYFPRIGLRDNESAPTILNGPSLATAGYIDPTQELTVFGLVPGLKPLRAAGYNVVTWDPRGEFASGGVLHLDSPHFEAQDVSAILDWVSDLETTELEEGTDDPLVGMVGGSYGGGIQLSTAGTDTRIDAIAPGIAWNNLTDTLYPHDAFKTSWSSLLLLSLVVSGSRIDSQIYAGILTGALAGFLTERQQEFLNDNSPDQVIDKIDIPTLFLQGTVDTLFPLQQALDNADVIEENAPVKMIWYCGGHGKCLDPVDQDRQSAFLVNETLKWMDTYVKGKPEYGDTPPPVTERKFEWIDQAGHLYSTNFLPTDPDNFFGTSIPVSGGGGILSIVPVIGGSGPQNKAGFPVSLVSAAPAKNAINVAIPQVSETTHVVGAPELTLTYRGVGTARNVYAQIVDERTNRVVGNIVSPIPVKLDGTLQTTTVSMENIALTMTSTDRLKLQIVTSATPFENATAYGAIDVSHVELTLPTATGVTRRELPPAHPDRPLTSKTERTLEDLLLGG